jgi:hypothetical protein
VRIGRPWPCAENGDDGGVGDNGETGAGKRRSRPETGRDLPFVRHGWGMRKSEIRSAGRIRRRESAGGGLRAICRQASRGEDGSGREKQLCGHVTACALFSPPPSRRSRFSAFSSVLHKFCHLAAMDVWRPQRLICHGCFHLDSARAVQRIGTVSSSSLRRSRSRSTSYMLALRPLECRCLWRSSRWSLSLCAYIPHSRHDAIPVMPPPTLGFLDRVRIRVRALPRRALGARALRRLPGLFYPLSAQRHTRRGPRGQGLALALLFTAAFCQPRCPKFPIHTQSAHPRIQQGGHSVCVSCRLTGIAITRMLPAWVGLARSLRFRILACRRSPTVGVRQNRPPNRAEVIPFTGACCSAWTAPRV